jgi:hypothetical protein
LAIIPVTTIAEANWVAKNRSQIPANYLKETPNKTKKSWPMSGDLHLVDVTSDAPAAIPLDTPIPGAIDLPGQTFRYTFSMGTPARPSSST